jgi:L-alanine-DL-glutamate epimerase-like enolase superfamily enzyme
VSLQLELHNEPLPLSAPFRISGYVFNAMPATVVTLRDGAHIGRGEAAGVYYNDDRPEGMLATLQSLRARIEAGVDRAAANALLPPGGARNALDCALWELDSRLAGVPVWKLAGVPRPRPLISTFTLPADDPAILAGKIGRLSFAKAIKLKLDGDVDVDRERIAVVRNARPDAWLGVDANQGFVPEHLDALAQMARDHSVSLIEQPLKRGEEAALAGWRPGVPVAADESILDLRELEERAGYFDVINIKLDKCGGLTEALELERASRQLGKQVMVGNMGGSTLAMAPGFVLGQLCDVVDLDGPFGLAEDPLAAQIYSDGEIFVPDSLWGAG